MTGRLTSLGSALAVAGAAHAAVNARLLRHPRPGSAGALPVTSVLVPARDEAGRLGSCLASLGGQNGVAEVLVLDDMSSDSTPAVAQAAGVGVLAGVEPPPGWLGKPWACAQLAAAADPEASVLVFIDADVRVEPGGIAAAVKLLDGFDLMCPFPRQDAAGVAGRLVQPLLTWSWLTTLPLRIAERSPRPSLVAVTGQFLVIRRSVLDAVGGFAAVRGEVLDDLALARAIKRGGGRVAVADGSALASCRMYSGWRDLRAGYRKSLWSAFGSPPGAGAVVAGLGVTYVLPVLAALRGSRVGALGYLAGVVSRMIAARATGGRAMPDSLAHPASIAVLCGLVIDSFVGRARGTLRWKRRRLGHDR